MRAWASASRGFSKRSGIGTRWKWILGFCLTIAITVLIAISFGVVWAGLYVVVDAIYTWGRFRATVRSRKPLAVAIAKGRELIAGSRLEEAFEFLKPAVQRFPEDAEIRLLYAVTLLSHAIDEVAAEAAKAVELGPDNPVILVGAGQLLIGRGDHEAAQACATRANELVPPDFILMASLDNLNGTLAAFAGEDDVAEEKLRSAVDGEPDNEPFARNLAVFLAERGRLQEGAEVLEEALKHTESKDMECMRNRMTAEAANL